MPKKARELSALEVKRIRLAGLHPVGGVPGLRLLVSNNSQGRSWVLKIMVAGKRREIGLGSADAITLASARDLAREMHAEVAAGRDPIAERALKRSEARAAASAQRTFDECAEAFIEAKRPEWSNAKHADQWTNTLATYASPALGKILVRDIGMRNVLDVLEPIWTAKTETATRVRARIEAVLDWATTHGYRSGDNPARWRGHLEYSLPRPGKVAKIEHHAALPVASIPAFMPLLRKAPGQGARALEFAILTAARSGEVRGATWSEIDLDAALWTIPAERMKAGREHRVPLSRAAISLLKAQPRIDNSALIFAGARDAKPLSDMTLSAVLKRLNVDATPHGFRSTFRDWCSEQTDVAREVAEMALAHSIGSKVEAAYRRGDLLAKRAALMQQWADYLLSARKRPAAKRAEAA